jgi:hypothetical protein
VDICVSTLERWYYRYKAGGLAALRPSPRGDRGRARDLPPVLVDLLLDIRREHPAAGVPLILRTLIADGRMSAGAVSATTVRRLYGDHGLDRVPLRDGHSAHTRLRWQADRPNALWHGDVCYGPNLHVDGGTLPLRIHGLLDDASRYFVAWGPPPRPRLLGVLLRLPPQARPRRSTSTTAAPIRAPLHLACSASASPDPRPGTRGRGKNGAGVADPARGLPRPPRSVSSLHDVNVRLWAWLDQHYHHAPHGSLFGQSPAQRYQAADPEERPSEDQLRDALTLHVRRRVRRDTTFDLAGRTWELDQGFLAGRVVTVSYSSMTDAAPGSCTSSSGWWSIPDRDQRPPAPSAAPPAWSPAGDAPRLQTAGPARPRGRARGAPMTAAYLTSSADRGAFSKVGDADL